MTPMKNVWVLNDNASKKPLWCCRGSHKASPPQLSTVTRIEPCRLLIRDNCAVIIHGTSQFLSGVQWHTFEIHLKRPQVALLLLFPTAMFITTATIHFQSYRRKYNFAKNRKHTNNLVSAWLFSCILQNILQWTIFFKESNLCDTVSVHRVQCLLQGKDHLAGSSVEQSYKL